jgi:GTP pyrophosphokinase
MIRKAFDVSVEAHKDQRRKSGEAYIPSAKIVASEIDWEQHLLPLHYCMMVEDTPTTVKT